MLIWLAQWLQSLSPELGFFRVFQYLTFRAVMAALTALLIGLVAGPWVIARLTALKIGQPVRSYGVQTHLAKSGTPTMGGVLVRWIPALCPPDAWHSKSGYTMSEKAAMLFEYDQRGMRNMLVHYPDERLFG